MSGQTGSIFPRILKHWPEPVAFRRHRYGLIRRNQPAVLLHLWLLFGVLVVVGGVVFVVIQHDKNAALADKGALLALAGFFIIVARFGAAILSILPMRAVVKDSGITINQGFPPDEIPWSDHVWFSVKNVDIGGRGYTYFDIVYGVAGGGLKRMWMGLANNVTCAELHALLESRGARLHENLDELVPLSLMGVGSVIHEVK